MINKIILTGALAEKFAPSVPFTSASVREAFLCLDANFPEFRKYMIDAVHDDIGFHVEVGGVTIEEEKDTFLNFVNGDILITAIPAGSKSGGQKVLAAAAIASLFFIPGAQGLLLTGLSDVAAGGAFGFTATGGLTAAGTAAAAIATNLALTGIQQLLAPDPSTDRATRRGLPV